MVLGGYYGFLWFFVVLGVSGGVIGVFFMVFMMFGGSLRY